MMINNKLSKLVDQYSELLKRYGIYLVIILFIFGLTLNLMLNKSKVKNEPPAKVEVEVLEKENKLVTSHQSPVTNKHSLVKEDVKSEQENKLVTNKHSSVKKDTESKQENKLVTSHQSPVTKMMWPVQGEVINGYGLRYSEIFADYRFHPGIDIRTKEGMEIKAAMDGKVILVENSEAQKIIIEIDHGQGWLTRYCHLAKSLVKEGQTVKTGEKIGQAGLPGLEENKDGSHLHLELKKDQQWVDPIKYLKGAVAKRTK